MTESDGGWLRRLVGGRRREDGSDTEEDPASLPPAEEDLAARVQLLVEENTRVSQENAQLAERVEQLEREAVDDRRLEQHLQQLNDAFQEQQASLEAARAQAQQSTGEAQALREKLGSLERAVALHRKRADTVEEAHNALQARIGPLREQAHRSQKQLQQQHDQLEQERGQRKSLDAKLEHTTARVNELQKQLTKAATDLAQSQVRTDRGAAEASLLATKISAIEAELEEARSVAQTARASHERALQRLFGPKGTELVEDLLQHPRAAD